MAIARKTLGDFLVDEGLITQDQLNQASESQKATRQDIGKILVELQMASERDVARARAQEMNIPFVDLSRYAPEASAVNIVPEHIAKRHNVIPVKKDSNNNTLHVAMADVIAKLGIGRCGINDTDVDAGILEFHSQTFTDSVERKFCRAVYPGHRQASLPRN